MGYSYMTQDQSAHQEMAFFSSTEDPVSISLPLRRRVNKPDPGNVFRPCQNHQLPANKQQTGQEEQMDVSACHLLLQKNTPTLGTSTKILRLLLALSQ